MARSITTCAPAMASLSPSPVMVLTPLLGEAATTSWPPWRRMATVEPIRPVPPMTTIFMGYLRCRGLAPSLGHHGKINAAVFRRFECKGRKCKSTRSHPFSAGPVAGIHVDERDFARPSDDLIRG